MKYTRRLDVAVFPAQKSSRCVDLRGKKEGKKNQFNYHSSVWECEGPVHTRMEDNCFFSRL
uniref:Uncharacterized protein n=1 Tax=Anguilla anguilla TaxID=7936 RepID=A0A0E9Q4W4_ANGAN